MILVTQAVACCRCTRWPRTQNGHTPTHMRCFSWACPASIAPLELNGCISRRHGNKSIGVERALGTTWILDIARPAFGIQAGVAWHFPPCITLRCFSPDLWYGYTLIWSRNAQAEDAAGLFLFTFSPFLQPYPYLWSLAISSHETRKAVRHKQPSNTEAPKEEPDSSGPGQPSYTPLHLVHQCIASNPWEVELNPIKQG